MKEGKSRFVTDFGGNWPLKVLGILICFGYVISVSSSSLVLKSWIIFHQ